MSKALPKRSSARRHSPAGTKSKKSSKKKPTKDERVFLKSLIAHGQAVKVPAGGKLPAGATHELVEDEDGSVRAVRKRFSAI